jgi:hypothetical protein
MAIDPSKKIYTKERNLVKKALTQVGATDIKLKSNYFYFSGFATINGQVIYVSSGDARSWEFPDKKKLMMRKAKDYKDFSGEINNYCAFEIGDIQSLAQQLS